MMRALPKPRSIFLAALLAASAGAAEAGSLKILNCSSQKLQVATYNSSDTAMVIAFKDACISGRDMSATLTCATASCKLKYWPSCPGVTGVRRMTTPVSVTQVYYNGRMYSMASMLRVAITAGQVPAGTAELTCRQFELVILNLKTTRE